jgi:hypothetical protein
LWRKVAVGDCSTGYIPASFAALGCFVARISNLYRTTPHLLQILVWKELNYGSMREKEKQLVVSEVRAQSR